MGERTIADVETPSGTCAIASAAWQILTDPQWVVAIITGIAATVAYVQYRQHRAREQSRDFLELSTQQFRRAFETLEERPAEDWPGLPEPDRLLWLTAARMLRTGETFGARITEESHQRVYDDARRYWRSKLYVLLKGLDTAPLNYFAETADRIIGAGPGEKLGLSEKSLRVVADFMKWPESEPDPLAGVVDFTAEELERMWAFQPRGLASYIRAAQTMRRGPAENRDRIRRDWPT